MSVCLCNLSADLVLELVAQNKLDVSPASPDPSSFVAEPSLVESALGSLADQLPKPIDLLVGSAGRRRRASGIASHVWKTPLPKNGVFALDEGLYVCSPEFTLLQQANQLHQANLCQMLGRYLGTWSPAKDHPSGQVERAPLTTFDVLREFLLEMETARGKEALKLAMAYTCDGAASAPETTLQLGLSLPPEMHGLNLTQPTMNYKVDLSSEAQRLYPHESIRIDLCWRDQGFGLEYQSEDHGKQLGEDYARWFAAREEQYELWFVAKEQIESAAQMMHIGREVAKRIGCKVNEALWPTEGELQELLDILAGKKHPKPMSFEELRRRRVEIRARQRTAG